jgi:hypothetical protein
LNHPRGWNTGASHDRKVKSYEVEFNWYKSFTERCPSEARVANFIGSAARNNEQILILEDLDQAGYPKRKTTLTIAEVKLCLAWLAAFHATFMGDGGLGLWNVGTYWHLNTRQDEFKSMKAGRLKDAAIKLDDLLTNCTFQTIVHGDAKVANFCFSDDMKSVAMVDFQYTGRGCGMKDVVYLLGSCLDSNACDRYEEELLIWYFSELQKALVQFNDSVDFKALEIEWRRMYAVAWTDFTRFLEGWMPTHKKLNAYSKKLLKEALKKID